MKKSVKNPRDGVVVRASASKSVDLGFIPLVESYQKTSKNDIYSFPAWRSAFMEGCGGQAGKFACCVLGQGTFFTYSLGQGTITLSREWRINIKNLKKTAAPTYNEASHNSGSKTDVRYTTEKPATKSRPRGRNTYGSTPTFNANPLLLTIAFAKSAIKTLLNKLRLYAKHDQYYQSSKQTDTTSKSAKTAPAQLQNKSGLPHE